LKISIKIFLSNEKKFFFYLKELVLLFILSKNNSKTASKKLLKKKFCQKIVSRIVFVVVFKFKIVVFCSFFFHLTRFKRNYERFFAVLRNFKCEK